MNGTMGADYMVEGHNVYQYAGTGKNWEWIELGLATLKYQGSVIELSFPRNWMIHHDNVKVAFYGNKSSFGGGDHDSYPNGNNFAYNFGGTGEFSQPVQVAEAQSQSSPTSHQPVIEQVSSPEGTVTSRP